MRSPNVAPDTLFESPRSRELHLKNVALFLSVLLLSLKIEDDDEEEDEQESELGNYEIPR